MKISLSSSSALIFAVGTMAALLAGCLVATDDGYDYYDDGGYYEPYGVFYGSWGPGYDVAPFRYHGGEHHEHRPFEGGGHAPAHAYRSAPASRPMPSLPSAGRSGGHRRSH